MRAKRIWTETHSYYWRVHDRIPIGSRNNFPFSLRLAQNAIQHLIDSVNTPLIAKRKRGVRPASWRAAHHAEGCDSVVIRSLISVVRAIPLVVPSDSNG